MQCPLSLRFVWLSSTRTQSEESWSMASQLSAVNISSAKPTKPGQPVPQNGLTSDEARGRLAEIRPQRHAGHQRASVAHGAGEVLGARALDARSGDRARARARQICRSSDHRPSSCVQRRAWTLPGKPRPSDAGRAEVAACADRLGQTGRRMEDRSCHRLGARRSGEALAGRAWWRRM